MSEPEGRKPGVYHREGGGLEFDRVSFFTDAVYAIAMTLLVVDLHIPDSGSIPAGPSAWTWLGRSARRRPGSHIAAAFKGLDAPRGAF